MQTRITARHTTLTDGLRGHIEHSVNKLGRYYDGIHDAHVILDGHDQGISKTAEVKLSVYRRTLTAQEAAPTYQKAVTSCVRQLRRQVLRYKDRLRSTTQDVHR